MRLSCNGCRVLRKGCTDACTIRPCLQWIKTPEAQANATVFLAKFYGRAGLLNLLAASPSADLRPAVFRSLLYEACGRAVNPVYGAVGLLWSGTWHMCQAAVEAVLKGAPIVVQHLDPAAQHAQPHHLLTQQHHPNYDIRHVVKHHHAPAAPDPEHESVHIQQRSSSSSSDSSSPPRLHLHKVAKPGRTPFKRTSSPSTTNKKKQPTPPRTAIKKAAAASSPQLPANNEHHQQQQHDAAIPSSTHCHASSDDHHQHDEHQPSEAGSSHVTTVPPSSQSQSQYDDDDHHHHQQQLGLHLTLGFFPCATATATAPPPPPPAAPASDDEPGLLRFL